MKRILRNSIINSINLLDRYSNLFGLRNQIKSINIFSLHSTRPKYYEKYLKILNHINKKSKFIDPKEINNVFNNASNNESFSILTFDDGFKDNYSFAKEILSKLDIKAIFFIIPKFITEKNRFSKIYFNSLYPSNTYKNNKEIKSIFQHMTRDQILDLQKRGHTLGVHGLNHENYAQIKESSVEKNIKESISILKNMNIQTEHFAYPFGSKNDFNDLSNKILGKYFRFVYTGVRGNNENNTFHDKKSIILKRNTISTHDNDLIYYPVEISEINFFSFNEIVNSFYRFFK